jgi:transposase-like protein
LAFERQQKPPAVIRADYWQAPSQTDTSSSGNGQTPDRRGLTGSARLLQDIYQLDQSAFETNKRKLQLSKTISLAQLVPIEFQNFRQTEVLPFTTQMALFDRDFPGHYLRMTRRVRTSIVALIPPNQGIRATLATTGLSRAVIADGGFRSMVIRRDPELVALTSPLIPTGLFEEVSAYVAAHQEEREAQGRALVGRHGHARGRQVTSGSGTLPVQAPRVADRRVDAAGERQRCRRRIVPPHRRRSPTVAAVLPMLSRRRWSTGDVRAALPVRLGAAAAGRSPTTIPRLTAPWAAEDTAFRPRDLSDRDAVSLGVAGVPGTIRLADERRGTLVVMGARADGTQDVLAVEDGDRDSPESWLTRWRDLQRHGMTAPAVAVGDGARGCWTAVGEVWPATRAPRGWVHRRTHGLGQWPKRLQPNATRAVREIRNAAIRADAEAAITALTSAYPAQDPQAGASLERDQETRLPCFACPAEPWLPWRTTNPVASPFSTVRLRPRVTTGGGSRAKGLVRADKLVVMAEARGRKLLAPHGLPLVQAQGTFVAGMQQRRNEQGRGKEAA